MKLGLGLDLRKTLVAGGPIYDPDAMAWFAAVELTGATFGPDSATVDANKAAWSDWVKAQKNAESPIAGRSNWDQLTEPGEGYIQPLMGVSKFNIPALFGASEFDNFVAGDYDPATGLRGGEGRGIGCGRKWSDTPQNDVSFMVILTEAPISSPTFARFIGMQGLNFRDGMLNNGRIRSRGGSEQHTVSLMGIPTPRTIAVSRNAENEFQAFNGEVYNFSGSSEEPLTEHVGFLSNRDRTRESDGRIGLATYGRSINIGALNAANIALSEAITWST